MELHMHAAHSVRSELLINLATLLPGQNVPHMQTGGCYSARRQSTDLVSFASSPYATLKQIITRGLDKLTEKLCAWELQMKDSRSQ